MQTLEIRTYISEPDRGPQSWIEHKAERDAVYANRRRIRGTRGCALLRKRGELLERPCAHLYETGGLRRTIAGRPNLNVGPNHVEGANVNLVIDGVVDSANPGASLPGEVKNNDISAPLLLPPAFRLSNVPCAESHSFTIYTPHAKITETSGNGPSFEMKCHGLDCASDQNDPVIQGAFRPRRGSQ